MHLIGLCGLKNSGQRFVISILEQYGYVHFSTISNLDEKQFHQNRYGSKIIVSVSSKDDCKFVHRLNGKIWRVVRGSVPKWERMLRHKVPFDQIPHLPPKEEYEWISCVDHHIHNHESLHHLRDTLIHLFKLENHLLTLRIVDRRSPCDIELGRRKYNPDLNLYSILMDIGYKFQIKEDQLVDQHHRPLNRLDHQCVTAGQLARHLKFNTIYVI